MQVLRIVLLLGFANSGQTHLTEGPRSSWAEGCGVWGGSGGALSPLHLLSVTVDSSSV